MLPAPNVTELDRQHMRRAITLARNGLGRVAPNPPVGCVIAHGAKIVGEGWHGQEANRTAHAEVNALAQARGNARGATAYVTLMPCAHSGKTPPCTNALIAAGIVRVVVAVNDPNPLSGDGRAQLLAHGISVTTGVEAKAASYDLRGFLKHLATGLPCLTLKYAMTLDGRTATAQGDSQWISSPESRAVVQGLRSEHDAVLVGSKTAGQDDPRLNVRDASRPQPKRVVVDSHGRTSPNARLFTEPGGEVIILTRHGADAVAVKRLVDVGARVIAVDGTADGRVSLPAALRILAAEAGVRLLLCEGGSELAGGLVAAGLVDEFMVFIAPKILGGADAPGGVGGISPLLMSAALTLQPLNVSQTGGDIFVQARAGDWGWAGDDSDSS